MTERYNPQTTAMTGTRNNGAQATIPAAPSDGRTFPATAAVTVRLAIERAEFTVEIDLTVAGGEAVALMGPSGAGKTTILNALAGLTRIDSGHITLGGTTLADGDSGLHLPPNRRRVGRLGQDTELFPHLSVRDNIAFAIRARGQSRAAACAEAVEWLARIGLHDLSDRRPDALSGGQAKRVALLRALAARPRLLLIDEPFASLDVEAAADIRDLIEDQLRAHPTTMILVSHDARDALVLANRLVVMEAGKVAQHGSVMAVLARPETRFVAALAATVLPVGTRPPWVDTPVTTHNVPANGEPQRGDYSL